ncbi:MAG: MaoC family dehydratase [Devosia sp.]
MTALKERRWEIMEVGETFGPVMVDVDNALLRGFAYSVDDFSPGHLLPGHDGVHRAHPALLCREARDVIATHYDIASGGAGMHVKHECFFHSCPVVGSTYVVTGRHTEKFIKRDKQYIVLESDVSDRDGRLLMRQRSTHIRALKPGVAKSVAPADAAPPLREGPVAANADEAVEGALLKPVEKRLTQEHLTVFAGTSWNNIHNDPAIARQAGLAGTIASGLQTLAAVSELMGAYFGAGWTDHGHIAVAFTAPLLVNQPFSAGARILSRTDTRVTAEVWAETPAGLCVLAGQASAVHSIRS